MREPSASWFATGWVPIHAPTNQQLPKTPVIHHQSKILLMWRWRFIRFPSLFLVITQWKSCAITLPVEHRTSNTSCWSTELAIRSGEYRGVLLRFGPQTYVPDVVKRGKTKKTKRERERKHHLYYSLFSWASNYVLLPSIYIYICKILPQLDFHRSQGRQAWVGQSQRFRRRAFQGEKCFYPELLGTGVWCHHRMRLQRCPW